VVVVVVGALGGAVVVVVVSALGGAVVVAVGFGTVVVVATPALRAVRSPDAAPGEPWGAYGLGDPRAACTALPTTPEAMAKAGVTTNAPRATKTATGRSKKMVGRRNPARFLRAPRPWYIAPPLRGRGQPQEDCSEEEQSIRQPG
jgi:hypothetical protein